MAEKITRAHIETHIPIASLSKIIWKYSRELKIKAGKYSVGYEVGPESPILTDNWYCSINISMDHGFVELLSGKKYNAKFVIKVGKESERDGDKKIDCYCDFASQEENGPTLHAFDAAISLNETIFGKKKQIFSVAPLSKKEYRQTLLELFDLIDSKLMAEFTRHWRELP